MTKTKSKKRSKNSSTKRKKPTTKVESDELERIRFNYSLAVQEFVDHMLDALMANQERKGDFLTWKPQYQHGLEDLAHHIKKLDLAWLMHDRKKVTEHCADIANICLAIYLTHGAA